MAILSRKRTTLHLPITLSVVLMSLNITLMVCWILLLAQRRFYGALTIGTIAFALILIGLTIYMILTIKEIRLNRRQSNFVNSVTHELKSPIATLRLYLETLQMRSVEAEQRAEFYRVMERELERLDGLITQLLEVGRLDAVGQQTEAEQIDLPTLLRKTAQSSCAHHGCEADEVFEFDLRPVSVHARQIVLEMIFGNLMDNAVKYGGEHPRVRVESKSNQEGRAIVRISDNGEGVPYDMRKKIFRIFYRGGNELERKRSGTGLGLYIVRTLVHLLKGKVTIYDRNDSAGSVFEVELPEQSKK